MKRRRFLAIAATAFAPAPALAQRKILVGVIASKVDGAQRGNFTESLRTLGWTEGDTLTIDWREAAHEDDARATATALAKLRPAAVVTTGPRNTAAMAAASIQIPIVFIAVADPVKLGLAQSLPRPGGNVTGLQTFAGDTYAAKLLELLKEAAPRTTRFGVLVAAANPLHRPFAGMVQEAARRVNGSVAPFGVENAAGLEAAFELARRDGVDALLVPGDMLMSANRDRIAALALKHRLPSIYMFSYYADAGGLISYGVSVRGLFTDAARLVDKILRGALPRDIPIEQPTRFELIVNRKTAGALGIALPQSLLLRADRVIE